ncbi:histidine kinase dimerization/phosphoacceptor domain -containing protein [Rhizobium tubonense]|uniref:histidine kinase dimerization/phosphoacceptor domain -containing protein n=1 Tax=Rhizobium tubonense TaxID=484088 RepID=UPI003B832401
MADQSVQLVHINGEFDLFPERPRSSSVAVLLLLPANNADKASAINKKDTELWSFLLWTLALRLPHLSSAGRISDPKVAELFAESRNRVRSMALVHENLYRAGAFARICLGNHIHTLCEHLLRAYATSEQKISVEVRILNVDMDLDGAVSCGVIVNEFARHV